MAKKSTQLTLPVAFEPSSILPVLSVIGGDKQIYDNADGSYLPDRTNTALILQPKIRIENPNSVTKTTGSDGKNLYKASIADAKITSVKWYYSDGGGDRHQISKVAKKTEIIANANTNTYQLKYYINIAPELSGRRIFAEVTYTDPNLASAQTVMLDTMLTTAVSASIALSLQDSPGKNENGKVYVSDGYELNPMDSPRVNDNGDDINDAWKRRLRCQLLNGTSEVKDAHADNDGYESDRTGNAFYFWYQVVGGREILITKDVEWFDGTFYADGTAAKECCVDLGKIQTVHLRCYAGYIPYGELDDFVDGSGMIVPSKCKYGYLRHDYRLNVRIPPIDSYRVIDVSCPIIYTKETNRDDVKVIKRLQVNSYGRTLNDMTLMSTPAKYTLVEKLFKITWELATAKDADGDVTEWTVISNREFMEATTKALGMTASNTPKIRVSIEPRYPSLYGNNYVVGYQDETTGVVPQEHHGNVEWLRHYDFVLCDMTKTNSKTEGKTTYLTQSYIKLRRDNLLRNAGGDFAPVVVISDEQYADSTLALYTKSGNTYKLYYAAGNYDPVAYVENMLRPFYAGSKTADAIKLYKKNSDGTYSEAHALLPWETVDNKWSIFLDSFGRDIYFLDNVKGESGTVWRGIFSDLSNVEDGKWDGIELSQYRMRHTGISPSPATTVSYNGKTVTRNMFYLKQGMTNCQGGAGNSNCTTMLKDASRTYPRVSDVNAVNLMNYARNNNPDVTKPYPCAEGGYNNMSAHVMALELIHNTKALYVDPISGEPIYGSGISSNEACDSEAAFLLSGGTRMRKSSTGAFQYKKWSDTAPFKPSSTESAINMTKTLNGEYPKEQCMESQIVLSFAKEFGIAPDTWFTVYGGTYKYVTPSGCKGLSDGYMNARVYKNISGTVKGYNTSTSAAETWNVEVMLRMSICGGLNLCGDIFSYWPGGVDVIYTVLNDPETNRGGNKIEAYYELDQLRWVRDTNTKLALATQFESQKKYKYSHTLNPANAQWIVSRGSFTPVAIKALSGGSIGKGECCYMDVANWGYGSDKTVHYRAAVRCRYYASSSICAPRSVYASYPASNAGVGHGGSAQVLL